MYYHQTSFALLYVLAVNASLLTILLTSHSNYVVLDLKCCAKRVHEQDQSSLNCFVLTRQLRNEPQTKSGQDRRLIFYHVEVLCLGGYATFRVVPINVPALSDMQTLHFLKKDSVESQLVLLLNKLVYFVHRCQVHEIASIYSNIYPKFFVAA